MERYKLLDDWLTEVLIDNPDVIADSDSAVEIYSKLYELWLADCQQTMRAFLISARSEKELAE